MLNQRFAFLSGLALLGPLGLYLACTVAAIDYGKKACGDADGTCPAPWQCSQGVCVLGAGADAEVTKSDARAEAGSDARNDAVDAGSDTSTTETGTDSGAVAALSCADGGLGRTNCGPGGSGSESCCNSLEVEGGTFDRGDKTYPATVSSFRLDQYEITVGRFRQFVIAVEGGWLPKAGSGKHTHLNGGKGLNATGGGYEDGWDSSWDSTLATTESGWDMNLECDSLYQTWTHGTGTSESEPITCETWYEAYAFCIWDGGFLPSDAEWGYAAAGGGGSSGQRLYPWSSPSTSTTIDCSHANYAGADGGALCVTAGPNNVGSESPTGDGAYGQADMAGNAWEWALDWFGPYVDSCTTDCANLTMTSARVFRGGAFGSPTVDVTTLYRDDFAPSMRHQGVGARCARTP
jgi:formylglycine-generating enzyme required for sulfatase activity